MNLEVFGQELTVMSDNEDERVRDIVDYVNRRLEAVRRSTNRVKTEHIALLAALNIAEELFEERTKHRALKLAVRDRSLKLLNSIHRLSEETDRVLGAGASPEAST